jgi:predicted metal-dependent TIM-barrel fold hydrolase
MKLMDCHLHFEGLSDGSLRLMAMSGIQAIVSMTAIPEVIPEMNKDFSPDAIFDSCDRILNYYAWIAKQYMIDTYVCVAVSVVGIPLRYKESLKKMKTYLKDRNQIIGIGEIGFEPDSLTCSDLKIQEEIIATQIEIAKQFKKTLCFHTPLTEKLKWFKRYLSMIKEGGLDFDKVIIDHVDKSIVKEVTSSGCYAGISVQPRRKVRAKDAAIMIKKGDENRILVNSDTCFPHESDPLSVPRTAFEMKKLGIKDTEIKKVLWENPRKVFGLSKESY